MSVRVYLLYLPEIFRPFRPFVIPLAFVGLHARNQTAKTELDNKTKLELKLIDLDNISLTRLKLMHNATLNPYICTQVYINSI